jgi:hypothetical protein
VIRSPRVVVPGAHIQFADTGAELMNLSPTGALIRMHCELRKGGEWPLVLESPTVGHLRLEGRVVRCRRNAGAFILALSFVAPSADAQKMLEDICSAAAPPAPRKEKRPRPLPWTLPAFSFERLLRLHVSPGRQCPECHCSDVTKERPNRYSCFKCGCRFDGYRIGRLRISL